MTEYIRNVWGFKVKSNGGRMGRFHVFLQRLEPWRRSGPPGWLQGFFRNLYYSWNPWQLKKSVRCALDSFDAERDFNREILEENERLRGILRKSFVLDPVDIAYLNTIGGQWPDWMKPTGGVQ